MHPAREPGGEIVEFLEPPERPDSFHGSEVVAALGLRPGMTVAAIDLGKASLTPAISDAVGEAGHVFAVTAGAAALGHTAGRRNIHPVEAPHHDTRLAAASCDRVALVNLPPDHPTCVPVLREAGRLLVEGGRLVIIDLEARLGFDELVQLLERNGWEIHGHGLAGRGYFVEAGVCGQSVQS